MASYCDTMVSIICQLHLHLLLLHKNMTGYRKRLCEVPLKYSVYSINSINYFTFGKTIILVTNYCNIIEAMQIMYPQENQFSGLDFHELCG